MLWKNANILMENAFYPVLSTLKLQLKGLHPFQGLLLLRCEQWGLCYCSKYMYSFVLLTNKTKKKNSYG